MTLPIPFTFATQSGSVPASELDNNFSAVNTSLTTPGTIVSANTTDLGTIQSNNINITGTTTILSFGSSAVATQPLYVLNFAAALTLTYNAASMILPTSANITTAAGDSALAWYLGSGNWQVLVYYRKSGSPLVSTSFPGAQTTLASASTTDLGAAGSFLVNITGTTSITSFGSSASASAPIYFLTFPGVLTLTYNATSLILPTSANITTAAGDTAVAQYLGSGNWSIREYQRASGAALVGGSGGGELVLLGTATASNSASLNFASLISSAYDYYFFIYKDIVAVSTSGIFWMRYSINNGSSYVAVAGTYTGQNVARTMNSTTATVTGIGAASPTAVPLHSGTANGNVISGRIDLINPLTVSSLPSINWKNINPNGGGGGVIDEGYMGFQTSGMNAIQFLMSTGNISGGTVEMYGVKNT